MNPVIYAVVDPTATDPKARMMPVSGTDNNDGTCSLDTTGGGGGGGGGSSVATAITVVNGATTNVASTAVTTIPKGVRTWIGYGTTSAGAGSCTLTVEGSMDGTVWKTIGTMTLTLATTITTDTNTDSFTDQSSFVQYRGRTASITGTGASVTLKVGI